MPNELVVTIIPNWNLKKDLGECLDSLLHADYPDHQIIVVDNGSEDGSPDFVRKNYPSVHLISLTQNTGYAAALNEGIHLAIQMGAAYVFALNNDTIVLSDVIKKLIERMSADPNLGVVSPKILYYEDTSRIFSLGSRKYPFLPVPIEFGRRWRDKPEYNRFIEYDYVTGCAMMIRTSLFQKVGLFDPTYFMYYEDNDFCRRVRDAGYRIGMDGSCSILHKEALSSKRVQGSITYIRARNRARFYRRFPHGPHPILTVVFLVSMVPIRMIKFILSGQSTLIFPYISGLRAGLKEDQLPK